MLERAIHSKLLELEVMKDHLAFLEELKGRGVDVESLTYGDLIEYYKE